MATLRSIKNVMNNYTELERKAREATSNDPWSPPGLLMSELAEATFDSPEKCNEITGIALKRLNDSGKNWRHVYKSLILLEYLLLNGAERVAPSVKEHLPHIVTLKDFQYTDPADGKDVGLNVRERSKAVASLLRDDEKLKEEREKAKTVQERVRRESVGAPSKFTFEDKSGQTLDKFVPKVEEEPVPDHDTWGTTPGGDSDHE
eukprot:Colp12_sorted_trinity150504_noHs@11599